MKYTSLIAPYGEGRLLSAVELDYELAHDNIIDTIFRQVLDTNEQQVRDGLIKLGWTPPSQDRHNGTRAENNDDVDTNIDLRPSSAVERRTK